MENDNSKSVNGGDTIRINNGDERMNLKEENKMLKRQNFELRFALDMCEFKNAELYSYSNLVENYSKSLLTSVRFLDAEKLLPLVKKYSFETVDNYFRSQHEKFIQDKLKSTKDDEEKGVQGND